MLKEKVYYREELPINCDVVDVEDYPIHFHDDLEVAFVLSGRVILKNGYYTYAMEAGDVFILNDREIHSYYGNGEPNAMMILQLDLNYFEKYYDGLRNSFFVTDVKDREDSGLDVLRSILAKIMLETLAAEPGYERRSVEYTHDLIDCLSTNFQSFALEDGKFVSETSNRENKVLAGRMRRITRYLYENYNRRLTLSEIAEREHLSIFYLSHVIKEASGLCFQDLLNFIRVEESEKLLLGTDKKIGAISLESGFSAVRYYIKYFTRWFGMHPSEYREKFYGSVRSRETSSRVSAVAKEEAEPMVRMHAKEVYEDRNRGSILSIELDFNKPEGNANTDTSPWFSGFPDRQSLAPLAGIVREFLRLEGDVVYQDAYCIVKADSHKDSQSDSHKGSHRDSHSAQSFVADRVSILCCYYDKQVFSDGSEKASLQEMRELAAGFSEKAELLLKLSGLRGGYRVSRCRLDRETILAKYDAMVRRNGGEYYGERERLLHRWENLPKISYDYVRAYETINIQCFFSGFSCELILLDRIS